MSMERRFMPVFSFVERLAFNMIVRQDIPLNVDDIVHTIRERQGAGWNGGIYYQYFNSSILQSLFDYMNSGIPVDNYFYRGSIYRIHCSSFMLASNVNKDDDIIIGKICGDGSCRVLPVTKYTDKLSSFSKCYDFTTKCYYKVSPKEQAVLFHFNTGDKYGLDINSFLHKYGYKNEIFEGEQEILFPFSQQYILKEYHCTPNQFKYYMRKEW